MNLIKLYKQSIEVLNLVKKNYPHLKLMIVVWAFCVMTPHVIHLVGYSMTLDTLLNGNYQQAMLVVGSMLVSSLLLNLVGNGLENKLMRIEESSSHEVSNQLAKKTMALRFDILEDKTMMDRINSFEQKYVITGTVGHFIVNVRAIVSSSLSIFYSLFFVFVLFYQTSSYRLNLILLLMASVVCVYLGSKIMNKVSKLFETLLEQNVELNAVGAYLINLLFGIENKKQMLVDQSFPVYLKYFQNVNSTIVHFIKFGKTKGMYTGAYGFILMLFAGFTYFNIAILSYNGMISLGSVLLYAGAIIQLIQYLSTFITKVNDAQVQLSYLNQLAYFIQDDSMLPQGSLPVEKRSDNKYEFEFKNVSFSYPNSHSYALKNVNLRLKIGDKLAMVGRNGAGKTTMVKLLCRLYKPTEGEILLNGIDIWKYDFDEYAQLFSPIFQDFSLFNMSIQENIKCGYESDQNLVQLLDLVGLNERLNVSGQDLMAKLADLNLEGLTLSGGESQKLAIGRALYKDAPFVILDEPTAALDPYSEAEIYEKFDRLINNKTALYISHRMSSCQFCDRIIVFKDGVIIEDGDHESLLNNKMEYYELFNAQAEYYQS